MAFHSLISPVYSISFNDSQFQNAFQPISVTLFGIVMFINFLQCSNAIAPMFVTPPGSVIPAKRLQDLNASLPMSVTLLGIVILVRLRQSSNVFSPMLITPSGIVILFKLLHSLNARTPMWVILCGIVILVRLLHSENTHRPILVTLFGIAMLVMLSQPLKARSKMSSTPSGMYIAPSYARYFSFNFKSVFPPYSNQSRWLFCNSGTADAMFFSWFVF